MTRADDFVVLDLSCAFNNDSISSADSLEDGAFNVWGNSFPAEFLPMGGSIVEAGHVPFRFPPTGAGERNTVVCNGQYLPLPPGYYDWIYLLSSAERRAEDPVYLHYQSGAADAEWLRVSDFWPPLPSRFGELEAFRCPVMHYPHHIQRNLQPVIWQQRIPVPRREPLVGIRLPDNVAIHLFAVTLARNPLAGLAGEPAPAGQPGKSKVNRT